MGESEDEKPAQTALKNDRRWRDAKLVQASPQLCLGTVLDRAIWRGPKYSQRENKVVSSKGS